MPPRLGAEPILPTRRRRIAALLVLIALRGAARAEGVDPFRPPPPPTPRIVRLLAPPEYFDRAALDEFERASGYAIAYDAFDTPESVADRWRDGPYDLVVLPGPILSRRVAAGALLKLDKSKLPEARAVQPAVAGKLAAYDPDGAHAIAFGWRAFGLLYDSRKAASRLGGAPLSWANLLIPREASRMADCGVSLPDARDAMFVAAWRLLGVDPARATLADVKNAGALLAKARPALRNFGLRDVVGSLAKGANCLSAGDAAEAEAASKRAGDNEGRIRFGYAREGGAALLDAFAIPRDAPHPEQAYALMNFMLRPDVCARNARVAGIVSAEVSGQDALLKRLWPAGALDERVAAAIETEWTKLRSGK